METLAIVVSKIIEELEFFRDHSFSEDPIAEKEIDREENI